MFEVGFSEILVISILALVVLGPDKLPGLIRQIGRLTGRARAMAQQFRQQLEDEVSLGSAPRHTPADWDPPPSAPIDSNNTGHSDWSEKTAPDAAQPPDTPASPAAVPPHERGP